MTNLSNIQLILGNLNYWFLFFWEMIESEDMYSFSTVWLQISVFTKSALKPFYLIMMNEVLMILISLSSILNIYSSRNMSIMCNSVVRMLWNYVIIVIAIIKSECIRSYDVDCQAVIICGINLVIILWQNEVLFQNFDYLQIRVANEKIVGKILGKAFEN